MENNILAIEKNILATVIYYDVLDYPLTSFEIWKHLIRSDYSTVDKADSIPATFQNILEILYDKKLASFLEYDKGFYFLKGRAKLVQKRIYKQKLSALKIKRLKKIINFLQYVPFVRMICVTGALAMKQAHQKSDWDLLVGIKSGKIWTGRTLFSLLVHFLGKRRHGKKIADRLCLNYFLTDEKLEIMTKDLFSANEYMFILPISGWETFKHFQLRNIWISSMKPAYFPSSLAPTHILGEGKFFGGLKKAGEFLFGWSSLELLLKDIEKKRIARNPKTSQDGSLVYAGDDALVFLPNPHGPKVFEKFKHNVSKLGAY